MARFCEYGDKPWATVAFTRRALLHWMIYLITEKNISYWQNMFFYIFIHNTVTRLCGWAVGTPSHSGIPTLKPRPWEQSLQANAWTVPQISPRPLHSASSPFHYPPVIRAFNPVPSLKYCVTKWENSTCPCLAHQEGIITTDVHY
jgi:hypothetical protein